MMKESVRWGLLLTLVMPPLVAQAQSPATIPWPNGRSVWERSSSTLPGQQYLSYRQAPQPADEPAAAETEPQPLPEPADAPPAPENETPVPTPRPGQSSLYDYSRIHATGMAGSYTTGNYCSDCASGWHWGSWWPRLFSGRHAGSCGGDACGENACAESCCVEPSCFACGGCCNWFGGLYGLVLARSDDGRTTLSYDAANWSTPLLRTSDADTGYQGGAELRFGRYLNDCWAIEANYWGLVPNRSEANVCNRCMNVELTSPILFDNLIYDNGAYTDDVLAWYGRPGDPALRHRLRRKFEAHNIALNLIRNPCRRTGCVHYELLAGIRYFKFDDNFSFATDYTSDAFGDDPVNEMDYVVDTENYLVGFQVGGRMDYYLWGGLSVNAGTALGIYGNHMRHEQFIWGGNGHPWVDGTWDIYKVSRTANDVAFLGDLFAGVSYDLTRCWRITCGYRATVASGVAVATSQIPRDVEFVNMVYAPTLNSNDSLVLHGGYAGLEFNW